jgi:hypothetical protein
MSEEIVRFDATARGTGRTTRAVESLRAWAEGHRAEKGVMVTHDAQSAATLKRQFFADLSNVTVIGMNQGRVLRGSRLGAFEADHHALAVMISGLLRDNERLRAEITRLESLSQESGE